jgi:hypothetical protein
MSFHSIYSKTCPQCSQTVARDAGRCACGHLFAGEDPPSSLGSLQAALKEEELYADYLSARAKQAAQAAVVAQSVHANNRDNANKAEEARRALESAEAARAEAVAQNARVARLAQALNAMKSTGTPAPTINPAPARPAVPQRAAPVSPRPVASTPTAGRTVAAPAAATQLKSCPLCTARIRADVMACTCGFSFQPAQLEGLDLAAGQPISATADAGRARLAREAERALQRARANKIATEDPIEAGRARLAREAERALQRAQVAKPRECPHCTAAVAATATRCACGYAFDGGRKGGPMPGLSLDPAEQAKLGDLFKPK